MLVVCRHLFIVVFDEESSIARPYAAIKYTLNEDAKGEFFDFVLTADNMQVMNPMDALPKLIRIKARLNSSGSAEKHGGADLKGEISDVPIGSSHIRINIDQKS